MTARKFLRALYRRYVSMWLLTPVVAWFVFKALYNAEWFWLYRSSVREIPANTYFPGSAAVTSRLGLDERIEYFVGSLFGNPLYEPENFIMTVVIVGLIAALMAYESDHPILPPPEKEDPLNLRGKLK